MQHLRLQPRNRVPSRGVAGTRGARSSRGLRYAAGSCGEQLPQGTGGSEERPSRERKGCAVPSLRVCPYRLRKSSFRYPFCKRTGHLSHAAGTPLSPLL